MLEVLMRDTQNLPFAKSPYMKDRTREVTNVYYAIRTFAPSVYWLWLPADEFDK